MADTTKVLLTFALIATFLVQTGEGALFVYHNIRPESRATKMPTHKIRKEADQIWQKYYENQDLQFIYPKLKPLPFCRGLTARVGRVCSPIRIWF